jgi:hypothetical protein
MILLNPTLAQPQRIRTLFRTAVTRADRSERPLTAENDRPKTRPTVSECIMLPVETSKRALASKKQTIEIATPF